MPPSWVNKLAGALHYAPPGTRYALQYLGSLSRATPVSCGVLGMVTGAAVGGVWGGSLGSAAGIASAAGGRALLCAAESDEHMTEASEESTEASLSPPRHVRKHTVKTSKRLGVAGRVQSKHIRKEIVAELASKDFWTSVGPRPQHIEALTRADVAAFASLKFGKNVSLKRASKLIADAISLKHLKGNRS